MGSLATQQATEGDDGVHLTEVGDGAGCRGNLPCAGDADDFDIGAGRAAAQQCVERALEEALGDDRIPACDNNGEFHAGGGEIALDGDGFAADWIGPCPEGKGKSRLVLAAMELAAIATRRGLPKEAKHYLAAAAKMEKVIYRHGWDGAWFIRAYDDFGKPVGSKVCPEGKIFIESQGMCIMAGVGLDDGRAKLTLASVNQHLATRHGIVLQQPAYSRYYIELGEISSYPPGYKENAGIFCHNNPWIIIAETMVGNGDRAFDYYTRINPSARETIGDLHRCEPYVYAQMIAGKDAPTHGEAKNSWLTGTAAWNYFTITQWILGIRTGYDGLLVDPVIPAEWKGFTVTRKFRGNTYVITVKNPHGRQRGVQKLLVDGKEIAGNLLPVLPPQHKPILVEAILAGARR